MKHRTWGRLLGKGEVADPFAVLFYYEDSYGLFEFRSATEIGRAIGKALVILASLDLEDGEWEEKSIAYGIAKAFADDGDHAFLAETLYALWSTDLGLWAAGDWYLRDKQMFACDSDSEEDAFDAEDLASHVVDADFFAAVERRVNSTLRRFGLAGIDPHEPVHSWLEKAWAANLPISSSREDTIVHDVRSGINAFRALARRKP